MTAIGFVLLPPNLASVAALVALTAGTELVDHPTRLAVLELGWFS
ncbi:MAG TPA: hypothetical protein VHF25_14760 [Nitriliruptorales bacterium]|nr:hypothetical protein [Nitriliruptorales bacterium]